MIGLITYKCLAISRPASHKCICCSQRGQQWVEKVCFLIYKNSFKVRNLHLLPQKWRYAIWPYGTETISGYILHPTYKSHHFLYLAHIEWFQSQKVKIFTSQFFFNIIIFVCFFRWKCRNLLSDRKKCHPKN